MSRKLFKLVPVAKKTAKTVPVNRALTASTTMPVSMLQEPLTSNELVSVKALTAYVAYMQNRGEESVQAILSANFGVKDVSQLRRSDYESAVAFLVDVQFDLLIN